MQRNLTAKQKTSTYLRTTATATGDRGRRKLFLPLLLCVFSRDLLALFQKSYWKLHYLSEATVS